MCARVKVSKTAAIQSLLADMGFSSEGLGEHLFEVNKDEQLFPYYKPLATLFVNSQSSMQQIHHRMPVMIEPEHAQEWLFSEDQHAIDHLMQPSAEKKIQLICESNSTESSSSQSNDKHDESETEGRPYTLPLF